MPGTDFDEVIYADDTIRISRNIKAMSKLTAEIETEGRNYGMKLNKTK